MLPTEICETIWRCLAPEAWQQGGREDCGGIGKEQVTLQRPLTFTDQTPEVLIFTVFQKFRVSRADAQTDILYYSLPLTSECHAARRRPSDTCHLVAGDYMTPERDRNKEIHPKGGRKRERSLWFQGGLGWIFNCTQSFCSFCHFFDVGVVQFLPVTGHNWGILPSLASNFFIRIFVL